MGILNLNSASFSSIGRCASADAALFHAEKIIKEGAAIIDVGAEPTNPGLTQNTALQAELDRLLPVIESIRKNFDIPISIDTSQPQVMQETVRAGAHMINDVRALRREGALKVIAELQVPVCLMHMSFPEGVEKDVQNDSLKSNPITAIKDFLQQRIDACLKAGVKKENIIVDPGFGHGSFGKNTTQNLKLLKYLEAFQSLKAPILVGLSRKTFIGEVLDLPEENRLTGSLAAAVLAAERGAAIIRVHDVAPTVQALKIYQSIL